MKVEIGNFKKDIILELGDLFIDKDNNAYIFSFWNEDYAIISLSGNGYRTDSQPSLELLEKEIIKDIQDKELMHYPKKEYKLSLTKIK